MPVNGAAKGWPGGPRPPYTFVVASVVSPVVALFTIIHLLPYIRYTVKHPPSVACCYQVISNIKYQAGNQSSSAGVCFSLYWLLAFSFVATPRLFPIRPPRWTIFGDAGGGGSQCSEVRPPPPDHSTILITPSSSPQASSALLLPSILSPPPSSLHCFVPPHYLIH